MVIQFFFKNTLWKASLVYNEDSGKYDDTVKWELINKTKYDYFNKYGNEAQRPQNPPLGTMYFDINLKKPIWYIDTGWVDSTGASV